MHPAQRLLDAPRDVLQDLQAWVHDASEVYVQVSGREGGASGEEEEVAGEQQAWSTPTQIAMWS